MLCTKSGKIQYRSYYSADRRLKHEKRQHLNKGGWVYKCKHCKRWHITYHSHSGAWGEKYKRSLNK